MTQCHMTTCHNNCCHLSFELKGEMTMPTDTFFHLPLDKQKRILSAAKKRIFSGPIEGCFDCQYHQRRRNPSGKFLSVF